MNFKEHQHIKAVLGKILTFFPLKNLKKLKNKKTSKKYLNRNPIVQCLPFYDGRSTFGNKVQIGDLKTFYDENR